MDSIESSTDESIIESDEEVINVYDEQGKKMNLDVNAKKVKSASTKRRGI